MNSNKITDHMTSRQEAEAQEYIEPDHDHPEFSFKLSPIEKKRLGKYKTLGYKSEYAEIAYNLLSRSSMAKTKAHVCAVLSITKPTLLDWMSKHAEFNQAVTNGMLEGSVKWRNKIQKFAFQPTQKVNNGLIKLLSANVYGIKDEPSTVILNQNMVDTDPEKLMRDKGIPVPEIDNEDMDDAK